MRPSARAVSTLLLALLALPVLALARVQPDPAAASPPGPDLSAYPWAYLRNGRSISQDETTVSLVAVGDIMLGRGVASAVALEGLDPWRDAGWLAAADLALGNLEALLLDEPSAAPAMPGQDQPIILDAPAAAVYPLRRAGLDILGLANNHALDHGPAALARSADHLQSAGLDVIGLLPGDGQPDPLISTVNGVRLAFLAFNAVPVPAPDAACNAPQTCGPVPAPWDPAASLATIAAARLQADAVVVSIHWGYEYEPFPDPGQETAAAMMAAAGADLIVGHHPHVAQRLEMTGDTLVAYSLGNFVFDQEQETTRDGLALRAYFDQAGLRGVQLLPLRAGRQPRLQGLDEAGALLARALPPPPRLGFDCDGQACEMVPLPPAAETGRFYAGQVDLTGDGLPETVRLEGEQIVIYEQGVPAWRSPEAWRVVDVALGDPNDDGRFEIMLALWQRDNAGYERSQPYILGHRRGMYDLLWGGRAVADPIQELVVGDVDGDLRQELAVIETLADGSGQAVSVWRWAGWTFTLVWRSPVGRYQDLLLLPGDRPLLSVTRLSP